MQSIPKGNVRGSSPARFFVCEINCFLFLFPRNLNSLQPQTNNIFTPPLHPTVNPPTDCVPLVLCHRQSFSATEKKLKLKISKNVNLCFQKLAFTCRASDWRVKRGAEVGAANRRGGKIYDMKLPSKHRHKGRSYHKFSWTLLRKGGHWGNL